MMDPCETYVKEAKRNLGLFKKNLWTAGLFYLNAAECYHSNGNDTKAFKNAVEAIKLLEKYWGKTNDVVLPDLEKALSLAFEIAPKNQKEKIARKAYEIYTYHASKLEAAGNYLAAAEKFEIAMQFARNADQAKRAILRAIAIIEKALEKPSIIKKKDLREKLEKKLEYLKDLLPEEPSKSEIESAIEKLSLYATLDVNTEYIREVLQRIQESLSISVEDITVDEIRGKIKVNVEFSRYSAYTEISCEKNLCDIKIFATNIMGIVLICGDILYHFEKNNVLNEVLDIQFKGHIKKEQIIAVTNFISRKIAMRFEARKIANWLEALIYFLAQKKTFRKIVDEAQKLIDNIKEVYVFDEELLPADVKLLKQLTEKILMELNKKW